MNRQRQIDLFSLAAHRLLVARVIDSPGLRQEALAVIHRWRGQSQVPPCCDVYWREWEQLLEADDATLQARLCTNTDHAATLRSVSPLGRFLKPAERAELLRNSRQAA